MQRMRMLWLRDLATILAFLLCIGRGKAQTEQHVSSAEVRAFFEQLMHDNPSTRQRPEEGVRIDHMDRLLRGLPNGEFSSVLPQIAVALTSKNDIVSGYAAWAMFSIGQRPGGAVLLESYAKVIGGGLDREDLPLQRVTVMLLGIMADRDPDPPREMIRGMLLAYVKRTDRDVATQEGAFQTLLQTSSPDDPDVSVALRDFSARDLDQSAVDDLLNSISNSHTENVVAVDVLISALEDPREGVRFTAAQGFGSMPRSAVLRARPALQKVLQRADESQEVKAAAQEALNTANRQKWFDKTQN